MKLTRLYLVAALFTASALVAPMVRAATGCPDDPERCAERGATVSRTAGVASCASQTHLASAPAPPVVTVAARKPAPAPGRKAVTKPAPRLTPLPASATPATPGMGMLLKLSGGNASEVSWYPSRPADNSGATWVL